MAKYTRCTLRSKAVEFRQNYSGMIAVGVDGWLVGNYWTAAEAVLAASECVRLAHGCGTRTVTIPARTRRLVDDMETTRENNGEKR